MTRREKVFAGLMALMFVLMAGFGIFLSDLSDTVHNTDDIVTRVTDPKLQKEQFQGFMLAMNCTQQTNLQRLLDKLVVNHLLPDIGTLVEPQCLLTKPKKGG